MILGQGHDTPLSHGQLLCEILSRTNLAVTRISSMCALWPWPRRYDLGSWSWHILGSWTTIVWNIIQIQLGSEELWPGHGFPVRVHCDLDLGDMTLGQGHDPPLGHGQQLCEILSRSNLAVRSYSQDTDFQYVCTVTLTLEIWPWVKVMTHPWVMDNNCVKLYPDRTREYKVMARTRCERTDRRTGWFLYTPQTLFAGGSKNIAIGFSGSMEKKKFKALHHPVDYLHAMLECVSKWLNDLISSLFA